MTGKPQCHFLGFPDAMGTPDSCTINLQKRLQENTTTIVNKTERFSIGKKSYIFIVHRNLKYCIGRINL